MTKKKAQTVIIKSLLVVFVFLLSLASHTTTVLADDDPQILILIGPQYGLPIAEEITPAMVKKLREGGISLDDIYVEYLDVHRADDKLHRANLLTLLQHKLKNKNIAVIIAINQGAVDFIAGEGKDFFPQAPLIIPIYEKDPVWAGTPRPLVTLTSQQDADSTLRYALDLFPRTGRVILIAGKDDHRAPFLEPIKAALAALPTGLIVEDTTNLSYEEMLDHISSLPEGTIAFYGSYFEDTTGRTFVPAEVAAEVASSASVPVFAFRDMHILQGLAGGSVTQTSELGIRAAEICLDYISSDLQLTKPVISFKVDNKPLFNWELLKRFGANPDLLPADTVFFNKSLTLWDMYKPFIIAAVFLLAGLVVLSSFLIIRNRQLRLAQEELSIYSETLHERIAERTAQLEMKNRELETFAYSVSHDLKAPLRGIDGYSRIIMEDYLAKLDESGRAYFSSIRQLTGQMNQLIDDLLAYTRLEQRSWQTHPVEIAPLTQAVLSGFAPDLQKYKIAVTCAVPDLKLSADHEGLSLIIRNLIDNAIKFSNKNKEPEIAIRGTEDQDSFIFSVSDNGPGFDMTQNDRIFDIFSRLHHHEDYPGTGIGLAMVRKAAERMGGRVWAESEPGQGASFYLQIPHLPVPENQGERN